MKKFFLIVILAITILISLIELIFKLRDNRCDQTVIMKNGKVLECKRVNFYASGFADAQLCNGERETIITSYIDTIILKNEK